MPSLVLTAVHLTCTFTNITMSESYTDRFAHSLLSGALYYDDEHGSMGSVSLVDKDGREAYIASFEPEDGAWLIERATAWDDEQTDDLLLAVDGEEAGSFDDPADAAEALIRIAKEGDYMPVFMALFEEPI